MKKLILSAVAIILIVLLFTGCSLLPSPDELVREIIDETESDPLFSPEVQETGQNTYYDIDPLGIFQSSLGSDINSYTNQLTLDQDYHIWYRDEDVEYNFVNKYFTYFGEDVFTYYNFYTDYNSNEIICAEYQAYFDAKDPDGFLQNYKDYYATLCHLYGENNIYEYSYKGLDSLDNVVYCDLDTLYSKLYAFEEGSYYISWEIPGRLVFYQVSVDNESVIYGTNQQYYDVYISLQQDTQDGEEYNIKDNEMQVL